MLANASNLRFSMPARIAVSHALCAFLAFLVGDEPTDDDGAGEESPSTAAVGDGAAVKVIVDSFLHELLAPCVGSLRSGDVLCAVAAADDDVLGAAAADVLGAAAAAATADDVGASSIITRAKLLRVRYNLPFLE